MEICTARGLEGRAGRFFVLRESCCSEDFSRNSCAHHEGGLLVCADASFDRTKVSVDAGHACQPSRSQGPT